MVVALLLCGAALTANRAAAQSAYNYITFTLRSGSEVSYSLADFKITYDADSTYVESAGTKYSLLTADNAKMRFTETVTGIGAAIAGGAEPRLTVSDDAITVSSGAGTLRIFSADGAEVMSRRLGGGAQTVSLASLPKGTYIIKAGSQTLKFRKK